MDKERELSCLKEHIKWWLVNVDGMLGLENHDFSAILQSLDYARIINGY